ncbi:hypothetical protein F383_14956 [Gossypium arboreum]|uniref:Uncharacterized protein n=1 Tax=Gossypium arboreum TaxID=29729 RepID=A0A0B0NDL6_GOSAR|nr:hypothetical protein F383_14956 [Gossypium arboreum]
MPKSQNAEKPCANARKTYE